MFGVPMTASISTGGYDTANDGADKSRWDAAENAVNQRPKPGALRPRRNPRAWLGPARRPEDKPEQGAANNEHGQRTWPPKKRTNPRKLPNAAKMATVRKRPTTWLRNLHYLAGGRTVGRLRDYQILYGAADLSATRVNAGSVALLTPFAALFDRLSAVFCYPMLRTIVR